MELPNPSNGEVVYTSRLNGSEAFFKCNEGYILSGAKRTTCLSNPDTVLGVWSDGILSDDAPHCLRK